MPTTEQRDVVFETGENTSAPANFHSNVYTPRERLIRAGQILGIFWILALLSIPILVAHWVLVPGFFLIGPVMAYLRYRVLSTSVKATGECPHCHNMITIPLEPKARPPLWEYCPVCNTGLQITDPMALTDRAH